MNARNFIYVAVIFLCGLLLGATSMDLAEHYWLHAIPRSEIDIRQHRRVARAMARRLGLNAAQQVQVNRILRHTVHAYQRIQREVAPQFAAVRASGRQQIRALLTPRQRQKFNRIVARLDQRQPALLRSPVIPRVIPMDQAGNIHP
jgi:hypothetical protein